MWINLQLTLPSRYAGVTTGFNLQNKYLAIVKMSESLYQVVMGGETMESRKGLAGIGRRQP